MNRRDALKVIAAAGIAPTKLLGETVYTGGALIGRRPLFCGWVDDQQARIDFIKKNQYPFISQLNSQIKGSGKGKCVLLYKFFERATGGPLIPHRQGCGDCVSQAGGLGVDVLTAVQMLMHKKPERWIAKSATEILYAGSRVEVGGGRIWGDGSCGVWLGDYLTRWGVLLRKPYLDGKYDFTIYSGSKAKNLGRRGVPDELEPLAKLHPVKTCALVTSWSDCRDAIANGYPVVVCSGVGFTNKRDNEGFLQRGWRPWYHAMAILGIDDAHSRPGGLIQNSWGTAWISGPKRHEQPEGSFWVDASTIDKMLRQNDSIALSGYVGYPRTDIPDYNIW